jgi:hypothetical protein
MKPVFPVSKFGMENLRKKELVGTRQKPTNRLAGYSADVMKCLGRLMGIDRIPASHGLISS